MSVHQESLEVPKQAPRVEEPPELAYTAVRNESLAMFGAALGGAVVGMMLTLLVLAIINGGTLNFSGGERVDVLEANLARVDENVGAVSYNVDVVAQQAAAIQQELAAAESTLRTEIAQRSEDVTALNEAVTTLDTTRQRLDVFIGALQEAVTEVSAIGATPAISPAAVKGEAAAAVASPEAVTVIVFVDANGNGVFDNGEQAVPGAAVVVVDAAGAIVGEQITAEQGAAFQELAAGEYELRIDDLAGLKLVSEDPVPLTVGQDGERTLYVPVVAEGD